MRKYEGRRTAGRKLMSLVLCVVIAVSAAGCGSGKVYDRLLDKDTPCTITIWHYYNGIQQMQFDEMVAEFNNTVGAEKGIVVEAYSKNSVDELAQSVVASVGREPGAEEAPDIFATYMETAYQIDQLGALADLSKYITAEQMDEYVDEYMAEGAFSGEGTLKIFPTAKSTEVMMLNLTDWQKFADEQGVTYADLTTWEKLTETAEKYYRYTDALTPDVPDDGKAFFGRDSVANYLVIGAKQLGHAFAAETEDGSVEVSLDKDTVRKLWDNFYVPYVKGYFTAESRFRSDDAKIGSIIALICSTTGATYYPMEVTIDDEYVYPIENVVLPVPNFEGCEAYIVQQGAGMAVIASDEKTEYASTLFLEWFTEKDRNIRFAVNSGYLPVKKEANNFEAVSGSESAAEINDTMLHTLQVAIDEINTYHLYTSPPYDASASVRDYIGDVFESTAKESRAAAQERIAAGEARDAVLEEYTDDKAYDAWYAEFEQGFYNIVGTE